MSVVCSQHRELHTAKAPLVCPACYSEVRRENARLLAVVQLVLAKSREGPPLLNPGSRYAAGYAAAMEQVAALLGYPSDR